MRSTISSDRIENGRIIPALTIANCQLVKTKKFEIYKYIGDPINAIEVFSNFGVDEIMYLDISLKIDDLNSHLKFLEKISARSRMPISYGGHIKDISFAREIFFLGFDKISIRKEALNLDLVSSISSEFGESALTICFDVEELDGDRYKLSGKLYSLHEIENQFRLLTQIGIGDLFFNYKYRDGMKCGLAYDSLIHMIRTTFSNPVIVGGGCATKIEAEAYIGKYNGLSVAASSIFTLQPPRDAVLIRY
jgi:cyclase